MIQGIRLNSPFAVLDLFRQRFWQGSPAFMASLRFIIIDIKTFTANEVFQRRATQSKQRENTIFKKQFLTMITGVTIRKSRFMAMGAFGPCHGSYLIAIQDSLHPLTHLKVRRSEVLNSFRASHFSHNSPCPRQERKRA
jgi:hypothetical protein